MIGLASCQYFQIKFYTFPAPRPFTGNHFYNPYQNTKSQWLKSNFHAHAIAWNGLTNGAQYGAEVLEAYRSLDYDIPCLSDYFSINPEQNQIDPAFIPVYEHGINIAKSHRLVIGSQKVTYYDVSLVQNQSIKQYLIERVKENAPVVAIAHPTLRNSHPESMFRYLSGYDCIEVLNSFRVATTHWDIALSSGKPVWLLANDDSHDVEKHHKVARCWTMVNADSNHRDSVLQALRQGQTYGVKRLQPITHTALRKKAWYRNKNILESLRIEGDTLQIQLHQQMQTIRLIGQNGKLLDNFQNTSEAVYKIKLQDTYIRVEALDAECAYYFNPVIRFEGENVPVNMMQASMDVLPTLILRLLIVYINLALIFFLYRRSILIWLNKPSASGWLERVHPQQI